MSKSNYPHFTDSSPSRWPWVLAAALVATLAIGIGVVIGGGFDIGGETEKSPVSVTSETTDPQIAEAPSPTTEVPVSDSSTTEATSEPALPTATAAPTGTPLPPTEVPVTAADVVTDFGNLWANGDYDGMYQMLSSDSQAAISAEDFAARYEGIAQEAGIASVLMATTGDADNDAVPVHVTIETGRVGTIEEDNEVQVKEEDGEWKILWTPSLIFSKLGSDCVDYTAETFHRGTIYDRNGEVLAADGIVEQVGIISGQFQNETSEVNALAKLLGMKAADIKALYKDVDPTWFVPVKELPDPIDPTILNGISEMPGVAMREHLTRIYPQGALTAHITGYVSEVTADDLAQDPEAGYVPGEMIGRAGLESGANELLSGQPGGSISIVDCNSRADLTTLATLKAVPPQDLYLSIDLDLQNEVDSALGDVKGSAVIIDPRDGGVLALVSHPSFDPNLFVEGLTDKEATQMFNEATRPLINRATQQGYPTGSIFKVITMAAGMEDLGYEGESEFYCPTDWSIPGSDQVWHDWTYENGLGDQGDMNLHYALVNSCDTIFYELGYELDNKDPELLPAMTEAFGLGNSTGIPYLPEIGGTVPSPQWKIDTLGDYWATGDAINLSIGQGFLLATPLQMANAYAAIANGGTLLQPYIVQFTQDPSGVQTVVGKRTVIRELPVSEDHIAEIQSALRDQTSNTFGAGSSKVFADYGWPIAGKTGTAENDIDASKKPHSWFAAFGPYGDTATIASIVMVESVGEGVSYAAPITKTIYDYYIDSDLPDR